LLQLAGPGVERKEPGVEARRAEEHHDLRVGPYVGVRSIQESALEGGATLLQHAIFHPDNPKSMVREAIDHPEGGAERDETARRRPAWPHVHQIGRAHV